MLYLDDGIVAIEGRAEALKASQRVRADLVRAELVEHTAKCSWASFQQAKWLGFNLNLDQGVISVPEDKMSDLKSQLDKAANRDTLKACELASIIGKIISMSLAVGPVSHLMTRCLYALLNSCMYWCQSLPI